MINLNQNYDSKDKIYKEYRNKSYLYLAATLLFSLIFLGYLVEGVFKGYAESYEVLIIEWIFPAISFLIPSWFFWRLFRAYYFDFKQLKKVKETDTCKYNEMLKMLEDERIEEERIEKIKIDEASIEAEKYRKAMEEKEAADEMSKSTAERVRVAEKVARARREGRVVCPNCGSESITTTTRGYTITTGFLFSGKVKCLCMNCGHKWKPGQM